MKIFYALLVALLVSMYNSKTCAGDATKASDCHSCDIPTGFYKCCYQYSKYTFSGQTVEKKECTPEMKASYDNIKTTIDAAKAVIEAFGGKVDKLDIDCSSKYLYIPILSLLLFLF